MYEIIIFKTYGFQYFNFFILNEMNTLILPIERNDIIKSIYECIDEDGNVGAVIEGHEDSSDYSCNLFEALINPFLYEINTIEDYYEHGEMIERCLCWKYDIDEVNEQEYNELIKRFEDNDEIKKLRDLYVKAAILV